MYYKKVYYVYGPRKGREQGVEIFFSYLLPKKITIQCQSWDFIGRLDNKRCLFDYHWAVVPIC